jgi:hypothetical protein
VGFPLRWSLGRTTPPRSAGVSDVFVGTGALRGGEEGDTEKLCWLKAGEEIEDDLRGDWAERVR